MSEAILSPQDLDLTGYYVAPEAYDELGRGQLPAHWASVMAYFNERRVTGAPEPERLRAEMLVRDLDVARPWRLDPIPFVLSQQDWQLIESGLTQRAELLNAIISNLYGSRSLLEQGGLPPALVFGNPKFALSMHNYQVNQGHFLDLTAFDVIRTPDGQWRVIADYTEAPQGLGLSLENRLLSSQSLPDLFAQQGTQRLAKSFNNFIDHIVAKAESIIADGIVVILSTGPGTPGYFEQTFLGQYLGFPVVEGADLTVRGDRLLLKTLEGLKPVGCVIRHPNSDSCDPLYLDADGHHGVAGMANIARQQKVHISNAIGAGAVANDAFMSFLPGLCEHLLDEELTLPSLATWWAGQHEEMQYIKEHSATLELGDAFTRADIFAPPQVNATNWSQPHTIVARESATPSYSPYLGTDGKFHAGPSSLRLFVMRTPDGYHVLPGGLARITTADGELAKDIWVPHEATRSVTANTQSRIQVQRPRASDRDLPSRTADHLFWLGRYLERCEGAVRAYRALISHAVEDDADDQRQILVTVLELLVDLDMMSQAQARELLKPNMATTLNWQWRSVLFDPAHNAGLFNILRNIERLANQVRERLSGDAWRLFSALCQTPDSHIWKLGSLSDAMRLMDRIMELLSGLNGQIQENMTRSYGWRLLELGRRLERGQFGTKVMGELVAKPITTTHLYLLLDLCDSTITYRARYQNAVVLESVIHLLLLDDANPRSMMYQISALRDLMTAMPQEQDFDELSEAQRLLLSAYHELILAEPNKLASVISRAGNRTQLRRVLQRLDNTLNRLSEILTATYFAHTHLYDRKSGT